MPERDWRLNTVTYSPFRNENHPSFVIGNKYGEISFIDFAETSLRGDCFYFVKCLFNLSTMNDVLIKIDSDFRILADRNTAQPTAYRVTKVDTLSYAFGTGGMICWMLVEDVLRAADNKSTMVADNTVPTAPTGSGGW